MKISRASLRATLAFVLALILPAVVVAMMQGGGERAAIGAARGSHRGLKGSSGGGGGFGGGGGCGGGGGIRITGGSSSDPCGKACMLAPSKTCSSGQGVNQQAGSMGWDKTCQTCSPGKYSKTVRSSDSKCDKTCGTGCYACSTGTYSDAGQNSCRHCAPGYYGPSSSNCQRCAPGTVSPPKSTSIEQCVPCPNGTYALSTNTKVRRKLFSTRFTRQSLTRPPL